MTSESKKIPIYIRVSSDDQVHGTSLQSQLQECRAALKRDDLTPGEVFADEGESAKSIENRPAFLRLLDHIKEYRPTAVMVHKIDRFARNNLEAQIVRSKLTKLGCRLLSATEAISDDPSGKFMFDVLSAVAEYDNRLRSERCRQGMVSQIAQGWWMHGPPLGYNTARTAQNKPTLTPDESRAPMIAEAFKLAASGVPQVEILSTITAMGLTTKSGKKITAQTLSRVLSNPAYAGIIQGKLAGDKPMKGRWPAIVSEEVYAKAQDRSLVGQRARLTPGAFPLRGLLTCGECGKKLTASNSRGTHKKYAYYHCPKCGLRFPMKLVEDAIQERINGLAMSEEYLDILEKKVNEMMRENFAPAKKEKEKRQKKCRCLRKRWID